MKKLIITEKSSAARRISTILSGGNYSTDKVGTAPVLRFQSRDDEYAVIGLRGHIIELDYPEEFSDWSGFPPENLIYAPQEKLVKAEGILKNIRTEMEDADEVIIATDYDREGELIGLEAVRLAGVPRDKTRRARFSALTKSEVENAFNNLTLPDERLADAAEARQIIDLAWGAVLTRMVSLSSGQLGRNFLSVGRVQSPTLKLLVERHKEIESFVPKPFWNINANFGEEAFDGTHKDNPFWSQSETDGIMDKVSSAKTGKVVLYDVQEKEEYRPPPFDTTQMQVEANRIGISPSLAMKLAEDLYTSGYISYPRTENTVYPRSLSLYNLLERLRESEFSKEVEEILSQEKIVPSRGRRSTTDHPPIHPTAVANPARIKGDKWKLYELIVRRFLATVAPVSLAQITDCHVEVAEEIFHSRGYVILERGWRKYYPYSTVNELLLPVLEIGTELPVNSMELEEKETRPPYRYNQGYLIQEMDRLGLGTKSTRHDILSKLYSRDYVQGNLLIPTLSGIALTQTLSDHGGNITETSMTSLLEEDMEKISLGERTLEAVVKESQKMLESVAENIRLHEKEIGDEIRSALREQEYIGVCASCGKDLVKKKSRRGSTFIACSGFPDCRKAYPMPRSALVQNCEDTCEVCNNPKLRIIRRGQPPQESCVDPECPTNTAKNDLGLCPTCNEGSIRMMFSKAGKRFAGCSRWPDCNQTYPLSPRGQIHIVESPCSSCNAPMVTLGERTQCINPECPTRPKSKAKKAAPKKTTKSKSGVKKTAKAPAKKKKEVSPKE